MKVPQMAIRLSPVLKRPATYLGEDETLGPVYAMALCDIYSDSIFGNRHIANQSRSFGAQKKKRFLAESQRDSALYVIPESPHYGDDVAFQRYCDRALFTASL